MVRDNSLKQRHRKRQGHHTGGYNQVYSCHTGSLSSIYPDRNKRCWMQTQRNPLVKQKYFLWIKISRSRTPSHVLNHVFAFPRPPGRRNQTYRLILNKNLPLLRLPISATSALLLVPRPENTPCAMAIYGISAKRSKTLSRASPHNLIQPRCTEILPIQEWTLDSGWSDSLLQHDCCPITTERTAPRHTAFCLSRYVQHDFQSGIQCLLIGNHASYCKHEGPRPTMQRTCPQSALWSSACGSGTSLHFQCFCEDYLNQKGWSYVVVVDRHSGWPIVLQSRDGCSGLVKSLRETFIAYGIEDELFSDGGPEVTAEETQQLLSNWAFRHRLSSVALALSNGCAGLGIKTSKRMFMENTDLNEDINLDKFQRGIFHYRNTSDRDIFFPVHRCSLHDPKTTSSLFCPVLTDFNTPGEKQTGQRRAVQGQRTGRL